MYDLLIRNARVIDGSGGPSYVGDVAVKDGKLVTKPQGEAAKVMDATGLALCPGFIDVHSHGDKLVGSYGGQIRKSGQGITTELAGQCGTTCFPFSADPEKQALLWQKIGTVHLPHQTMKDYRAWLETQPMTTNLAVYIGHSAMRMSAMGYELRVPTEEELEVMKNMVREAMEHGAMGMSSGLIYPPSSYADEHELVELCKIVAQYGGTYATHIRGEGNTVVEAVTEAITIAEKTGCRLNISHHKISGRRNWGKSKITLDLVHQARQRGVDVTLDQYPYTASSTYLSACLPQEFFAHGPDGMLERLSDPAERARLRDQMARVTMCGGWSGVMPNMLSQNKEALGRTIQEYADSLGQDPFEVYFDLMVANKLKGSAVYFSMCDEDLDRIICDPNTTIGTDGGGGRTLGPTHPRSRGTFPRAIRLFVRERKLMSLEQMIHKMTGLPAQRFHLKGKGLIADGMDADLVLFDPETITDRATYAENTLANEGIHTVFVAGVPVLEDNELTGAMPGKFFPRCDA